MNTITTTMDDVESNTIHCPGAELGKVREQLGYSREYVANKLHLRVRLIELLETDDYLQMPEPVFIMGYIRAYAKLLSVAPEPYIASYNAQFSLDKRPEKALWQSKRESNKSELVVRLVTAAVALTAVIAISFWWQKNKDAQPFAQKAAHSTTVVSEVTPAETQLSQVSTLQSLFSSNQTVSNVEGSAETVSG